jgi:hypothetical protein
MNRNQIQAQIKAFIDCVNCEWAGLLRKYFYTFRESEVAETNPPAGAGGKSGTG